MDITFSCPNCEQELEVDAEAAGTELECPTCQSTVTVPSAEVAPQQAPGSDPAHETEGPPIAKSAAAKEEKHFRVPQHEKERNEMIAKPNKPLEAAAHEDERKLRIKCFKHADCVEIGKDQFEEMVSTFLDKIGQENIVSINTISYTTQDMATQKLMDDFGVLIVYKTK